MWFIVLCMCMRVFVFVLTVQFISYFAICFIIVLTSVYSFLWCSVVKLLSCKWSMNLRFLSVMSVQSSEQPYILLTKNQVMQIKLTFTLFVSSYASFFISKFVCVRVCAFMCNWVLKCPSLVNRRRPCCTELEDMFNYIARGTGKSRKSFFFFFFCGHLYFIYSIISRLSTTLTSGYYYLMFCKCAEEYRWSLPSFHNRSLQAKHRRTVSQNCVIYISCLGHPVPLEFLYVAMWQQRIFPPLTFLADLNFHQLGNKLFCAVTQRLPDIQTIFFPAPPVVLTASPSLLNVFCFDFLFLFPVSRSLFLI